MRVIVCRLELFGGESEGLACLVYHATHVADTLGALGLAAMPVEHIARLARAGLYGLSHIAPTKTVAVADVHGE